MKKANSIVLVLILSLLLVGFSYTNSNEHDEMITRHDKDETEFIKLAEKFEKYMCNLNLPGCEGTIIADQWAISAAHCAVYITEKFNRGLKHFVTINDVEIEVDKVMQAKLYVDEDEVDKLIYMVGRGDKGDGLIGVNGNDGKQRGATNRIETATGNWLAWTFDHPDTQTKYLTEYEGMN